MAIWRLEDETVESVGTKLAALRNDIAWCFLAGRDKESTPWTLTTLSVRPIQERISQVVLSDRRLLLVAQHISGSEASRRWANRTTGLVPPLQSELPFRLLGDRAPAYWITTGTVYGRSGPSDWPEYQTTWQLDGARMAQSWVLPWEP